MATLNTLRTKFGVVLSAVIAIALLAFVFSLKSEMGFSGNDPIVAVVDGKDVSYSEYLAQYEEIKSMNGLDESNNQQLNSLISATLQSFINKLVIAPGFEKLGISVSEPERLSMISGDIPTQAFYNSFADPATGAYDRDGVAMFLLQAGGNPEAEKAWQFINDQAKIEREATKYISLLGAGGYVNDVEVQQGVAHSNTRFAGRWVSQRYNTVADSLLSVSNSEIKKYYEENKAKYKRTPSRTLSYVTFNIAATDEDKAAIEEQARVAGTEFEVAEDIRAYVRENRYGHIATNFVAPSALIEEEAQAFAAQKQYGPTLKNNTWRISRPMESRMAPDSMGIRIIALAYTSSALADSLLVAINGGAEFAQAATENSLHSASAQNGGDIGVMPYSALTVEMADALADAKNGSTVKVEVGDMIQILQAYNVGKKSMQYRVAAIEYPIVASISTINKAHNDAALFVVDAKGSKTSFDEAVTKHEVSQNTETLPQGQREIHSIGSSRELVRWVNGAKKGDLSPIFKVDNGYVVATLTGIDDSKYRSLEDATAQIKSQLLKEKKFEYIAKDIKGTTLDEIAQELSNKNIREFEDVNFGSHFVPGGIGVEPRVIGAITATTQTGEVSAPIRGNNALYVFEVTAITQVEEPLTQEDERVRLQAAAESLMQQSAFQTLQDMAEVEDFRGLYF